LKVVKYTITIINVSLIIYYVRLSLYLFAAIILLGNLFALLIDRHPNMLGGSNILHVQLRLMNESPIKVFDAVLWLLVSLPAIITVIFFLRTS